jgi:hypothetical protein
MYIAKRCRYLFATAAVLFLAKLNVQAQVITFQGGLLTVPNFKKGSFAYELEYKEVLYHGYSFSVGYVNEGHVQDDTLLRHHQDGYSFEAWCRLIELPKHALSLQLGLGALYLFDTQTRDPDPSRDIHRVAPMATLEAHGRLGLGKLLWTARVQRINANGANTVKTNMAMVGVGYWLGKEEDVKTMTFKGVLEENGLFSSPPDIANELTAFALVSVINARLNPKSFGEGLEYRRRFSEHIDATLSFFNEGNPKVARRKGIAPEIWDERMIGSNWRIGAGLGAYVFVDKANRPPPGQSTPAQAAGIVSGTISRNIGAHWLGRFIWDRVITSYNHDADIWRIGLGYRWGGAD